MNNNKHIVSNQLSNFFLSKRSRKSIYKMNSYYRDVLRYICDSIDKNYSKYKKFETELSHRQIYIYCDMSSAQVKRAVSFLIKKRFLKKEKGTKLYQIGKVIVALLELALRCSSNRATVRSRSNRATSNVSNLTNIGSTNHKDQKPYVSTENQTTSITYEQVRKPKPLSEEGLKHMKETMVKLNVKDYGKSKN